MKKTLVIVALFASSFAFFASTARAITAREVVNKYIEARGGLQRLEALKTLTMKGTMLRSGQSGRFLVVKKTPNLWAMRLGFPSFNVTRGCNGKDVWTTGPFGFKRSSGKALQNDLEESRIEPLIGFEQRGGKYAYLGIEPVMGDSCHKLLIIQPSGDSSYAYYDVHTFLEVKTEMHSPEGLVENFSEDFRSVDGYVFPHKVKVINGQDRILITTDSIFVNTPVADTFFVMPDSASVPSRMVPLPDSVRGTKPGK